MNPHLQNSRCGHGAGAAANGMRNRTRTAPPIGGGAVWCGACLLPECENSKCGVRCGGHRTNAESDAALDRLGAGFPKLLSRLLVHGDDSDIAMLGHLADIALHQPAANPPASTRRPAGVVETFSRAERDAQLDRVLDEMRDADPGQRRLLIEVARGLHSAAEKRQHRRRALRALHRTLTALHGQTSERTAAAAIMADLRRRDGSPVLSSGDCHRDRLVDAIIAATGIPSDRLIRADIAP